MKMDGTFWINRHVFVLEQELQDLQDCMNGCITSNAMGWNLTCITKLLYLFLIYHMDVRNIVSQDITYLYMESNLTRYWTIMVATMDTRS